MSQFLQLLNESDKASSLAELSERLRTGKNDSRIFSLNTSAFDAVPGKPFAYWVSDAVRQVFKDQDPLENSNRTARQGLATAEDFRFIRTWWESNSSRWFGFAKGGEFSQFYADVYLLANWGDDGGEIKAGICRRYPYLNGNAEFVAKNPQFYLRPGITWSRRTQGGLSLRAMPAGCIFADKGPAIFIDDNQPEVLLALLALVNSRAFALLVSLQMAFGSYEVGVIQKTPIPTVQPDQQTTLATLAHYAWSLKRKLDTVFETSHAFLLPEALRSNLDNYNPINITTELEEVQRKIDDLVFDLYGFSDADRSIALGDDVTTLVTEDEIVDNYVDEVQTDNLQDSLLSWTVGVAFGRFDWQLATGEHQAPLDPEPFDPLPKKSPGMLQDDAKPFHRHGGILVDDPGHRHDLPHLIEEVLNRVSVSVPDNVRHWLQKDFFAFHLKLYSKSRRKAPIYWPLSTASGSYTLWIYYPSLTSQTLFTAVNDFLDGPNGKLTQVIRECSELRLKGNSRSSEDEKRYEMLQTFEQELTDFRDTLLKIAPMYQPNHDDGVQITAAPLWPLFRHKPWQKLLKDTWIKLEKGDYDWAHLAMNYWPERVREKCKTDKSLAIAHGLESLYIEPEVVPKKTRGKKKAGIKE